MNRRRPALPSRRARWLLIALLALVTPFASAQAAPKYGNSLDWAPADVAFYSAALRNKEQIDIVAASRAWQRVVQMPAVQSAWVFFQMGMQANGAGAELTRFFQEEENKELLALVGDGFSSEVVFFGSPSTAPVAEVLLRTFNAMQYSTKFGTPDDSDDQEQVVARAALDTLDKNRDRLAVPSLVIGFKVGDAQRATRQIARLETFLTSPIEQHSKLKGHLKRATAAGTEYLTLELDGDMIAWDQLPWDKVSDEPQQFKKLQEKLRSLKAVISIGQWRDYVLLSIGPSLDHLATLGTGKAVAEIDELGPVAKFADRRLTQINYVSKDFLKSVGAGGGGIKDFLNGFQQGLTSAGVSAEIQKRIAKDAEEFADDLKRMMPEVGAQSGFSFLTERGIESYLYNWAQNLYYDGSKPLDLLQHVGGSPLLAVVSRTKPSPEGYELLRKWLKKSYGYVDEFATPQMSAEDRQKYGRFKTALEPLVQQLDRATSQMLIPALKDGQGAFVMDAKITSKQWFEALPQGDRPLPMLELALVLGVSDATMLKQACEQYKFVADGVIERIKELEPGSIPADFAIPPPETTEVPAGSAAVTIYGYKLPEELGADPQLMLNAGLSSHVAVLSFAPKHTVRLLTQQPLAVEPGGPLSDPSKPLAAAAYCNWASTVDAMTPWIDFAVRQVVSAAAGAAGPAAGALLMAEDNAQPVPEGADDDPSVKYILDQVHTVLDLLKTMRTYESASYFEGPAMVTHSLTVFRDVQ